MVQEIKINSILGGISSSQYFGQQGQYLASIGIDPDYPTLSTDIRTSGCIIPSIYTKFSGSNVTSAVVAIITNPKDTNIYVVLNNGRLISYSSSFGSETLIGTVTGGVANGAWLYNNYIYISTGTDVSRYGPLNNSPTLTNTVWTGATLGSLHVLSNATYPSLRGVAIPNHWGMTHVDGFSYFLDFGDSTAATANAGRGLVHRISTKKVTNEGDTNDTTTVSAYGVLILPYSYYPVSICSYSTDIAILCVQTTDTTVAQSKATLFLWDPTNTESYYRAVSLPDPLATAITYVNGSLYIWSGNAQNGVRLSKYSGGDVISDVAFLEEGQPPFAGGVDAFGTRLVWGGYTTYPTTSACVYAYGSKSVGLPPGVHCIVKTTSANASNQNTTAIKFVQQASNIVPRVIAGWNDGSGSGIDKYATTGTLTSVFRVFVNIGKTFKIKEVRIPLGDAVAANMSIVPKLFFDNATSSSTLGTISTTLFSGKRYALYKLGDQNIGGVNDFLLELTWGGTVPLPVLLPIVFSVDIVTDETT